MDRTEVEAELFEAREALDRLSRERGRIDEYEEVFARALGAIDAALDAARSPQGEDHEAGIEAAERRVEDILGPYSSVLTPSILAEQIVAAVLDAAGQGDSDDERFVS